MKYTEKQISKMASPISQSEDEKCKNAIRMVRDAMKKLNYTDDGKDIRSYIAESYSYAFAPTVHRQENYTTCSRGICK